MSNGLPRSKRIYALDLPDWVHELAESEARALTDGSVNKAVSLYVEQLFTVQRAYNRKGK